ncbi:MAG TPA: retropepsin-like aspartic protease, partial [Lacipirellulaceae bacterium]|nr:retropepsin-like aspartic protease [Lacipirellulaceae bacterium]
MTRVSSGLCMRLAALAALCTASAGSAAGAGVPIDGFLPLVAITLTDEFVNDLDFFPYPSTSLGGSPVSSTAGQWYELALLDSGAAVSLITAAADAAFNIGGPRPGNNDGFRGTETITIGGATGFLQASIGDPLGLYAAGVQGRTASSGPLSMNPTAFQGQTNTSLVTLPAESTLPNILGLSFMSQYATRIRNSQPQVFEADGKTVRTPAIDFLPLGSGDTHGIARKAPMSLLGAGPSTPLYFPNIANLDLNRPWENPSQPTVVQGGHFLNINAANNGSTLSNQQFFFDTGASVTVLSELTALQLGIDVQLDTPDFTIQIIGSGGLSDAIPGYFLDSFTVLATGGSVTATNVPILVFDVTNPASPGNIVPGIVGTNMFAGRDIIIDPNPSQGGGGASAGVYISDPVTVTRNWTSAAPSAAWSTAGHWSGGAVPTLLGIANVQHVSGGHQQAVVSGEAVAWSAKVAGAGATQTMTLSVATGAKLTTF